MNLAQDFSPGTALSANDLVPEARLSPWALQTNLLPHRWVFTQSLQSWDGVSCEHLVPEARLSPCLTCQFARLSCWFSHSLRGFPSQFGFIGRRA